MNTYIQKVSEHGRGDLELAKKELGVTRQKIDKLLRLVLETDVSSETISDELKRLEESKAYLERRMNELTINDTAILFTESLTADLLSQSRDIVRRRNLVECRNLMYAFVENVVVCRDSVEVLFKVSVPDDEGHELVPLRIKQSKEAIAGGFQTTV
jgi:DNA-binding transcriptional MerR regulator